MCREASTLGVPLIATVRAANEGGAVTLGDAQRLAIFEAVAPLVDALDIENHAPIRDQVVALAQGVGRLVIVSHHDFDGPATAADMVAVIDAAKPSAPTSSSSRSPRTASPTWITCSPCCASTAASNAS